MDSKDTISLFEERFNLMQASLTTSESFGNFRILHGYWDKLTKIRLSGFWPISENNREKADFLVATEGLISSGFAEELNTFMQNLNDPIGFLLSISTIAQPKSAISKIKATESLATLRMITQRPIDSIGATLPKYLVESNQFYKLLDQVKNLDTLIVAPAFLTTCNLKLGKNQTFLDLPEWEASLNYQRVISDIQNILINNPSIKCVVFSAGNIPALVGFKLFNLFPGIKWLDLGLSLSVFNPDGIVHLPWFHENYVSIMKTFFHVSNNPNLDTSISTIDLDTQKLLVQRVTGNFNSRDYILSKEIIGDYIEVRSKLNNLPQLRLSLLQKIFESQYSEQKFFLNSAIDWEVSQVDLGTFSSKLLLANILKQTDGRADEFLSLCDELTNLSSHDYRSRLLKTRFYLDAGELRLASRTYNEELATSFSNFRQVKKIHRRLIR